MMLISPFRIEVFGTYIHAYKYNEGVADGVVLDLRYEYRDVPQDLSSQDRVDQWFEVKTRGLSSRAKAKLKEKWGTMQKVYSSRSRLEKVAWDIIQDFNMKPRLMDGNGNARKAVDWMEWQAKGVAPRILMPAKTTRMMVITSSRLAAVRYCQECRRYIEEKGYDVGVLVAFSGAVQDGEQEYTEPRLNVRRDGSNIAESQTKAEFHENFHVLIVAEKYQTGFDEPLLHTMIVDKKLRGVKAVQTLSRLNHTCPGKTDTFVLDFVNTREDIREAFQPFYQETMLEHEVNADLLYQVQKELRGYGVYSDEDIEAFAKEYFSGGKQDARSMGRMTSVLKPVADRYNQLTSDARYQFRRLCRNLKKWYGYISQVVRMFDADLHREYVFVSYLLGLIPAEATAMIDLEGKLQLEYYKLQKTFEGAIELEEATGVYQPASAKGAVKPEEKQPLDEIIEKINEQYRGQFTDADRVLVDALRARLLADKKLQAMAQSSGPQIFRESIFPKAFGTAAQDSYMEATDTYTSLFEDQVKYNAIMNALGAIIYRDMRG